MSEIKALEWVHSHVPHRTYPKWTAETIVGQYVVVDTAKTVEWRLDGKTQVHDTSSVEAAKAAAQADYEARIRSALVERKAEPVAWLFEGDGWGREVMLSHQEALDRKERLSRTWDIEITPLYAAPVSTPPAAAVRVTDEMVAAYKAAYRQHTDACILGFIPPQTDGIIIEATRRGIAAALSASPSPVDSRELIGRLVKALEPFARLGDDGWGSACPSERVLAVWWADDDNDPYKTKRPHITQGDIRNARRVLAALSLPEHAQDRSNA